MSGDDIDTYIEHQYSQKVYISIFLSVPKYTEYILISRSFINLKQLFTYHDRNGRRKGEQDEEENCVQCKHVAKERAPVSTQEISQLYSPSHLSFI